MPLSAFQSEVALRVHMPNDATPEQLQDFARIASPKYVPSMTIAMQSEQVVGTLAFKTRKDKEKAIKHVKKASGDGMDEWEVTDMFPGITVLYDHPSGSEVE